MRPNTFEYAYKVTLPTKKDGNSQFCGDYHLVNMQTRRDAYLMPLIEDPLTWLGVAKGLSALDLQSGFWQIKMNLEDVKKIALIMKSGLYEWLVLPFGLKNVIGTFSQTMVGIFAEWMWKFLKIFVDYLNIHKIKWEEHF